VKYLNCAYRYIDLSHSSDLPHSLPIPSRKQKTNKQREKKTHSRKYIGEIQSYDYSKSAILCGVPFCKWPAKPALINKTSITHTFFNRSYLTGRATEFRLNYHTLRRRLNPAVYISSLNQTLYFSTVHKNRRRGY
jgi:hypothetical protein